MGKTDRKHQEDAIRTILFIDESESHRFLLSEELAEVGYKVVRAISPDKALKNLIESLSTQSFRSRNKPSGSRRQKRLSDRGQVHPTHERDEGRNSDE
jgi:hypothetical protein